MDTHTESGSNRRQSSKKDTHTLEESPAAAAAHKERGHEHTSAAKQSDSGANKKLSSKKDALAAEETHSANRDQSQQLSGAKQYDAGTEVRV